MWDGTCYSYNYSGSYAHYYTFSLGSARNVDINLKSDYGEGLLYLLAGEGERGRVITDSSQGELEVYLEAGNYTIEVATLLGEVTGRFSLSLYVE